MRGLSSFEQEDPQGSISVATAIDRESIRSTKKHLSIYDIRSKK